MKYSKKTGFTLIELIVASAVLSTIMLAAAAPFVSVIEFRRDATSQADVNDNLKLLTSIIDKEVRTAEPEAATFEICTASPTSSDPVGFSFRNQFDEQVRYEYLGAPDYKLTRTVMPATYTVVDPCIDNPPVAETYDVTSPNAIYLQDVYFGVEGLTAVTPTRFFLRLEASSDEAGNNNVVLVQNTTLLRNRTSE
jgi:prepilin-type N-terminal cleavage/methylation domain-containing protein